MALQFSDGRFQQDFFAAAQTMLENDNSAYYDLARNTVAHVDTDHLFTFGMNLGDNGCTVGAQRIRKNEASMGVRIPWTVSLQIDVECFLFHSEQYHGMIYEGEKLGIYTWMLFVLERPMEILPLVETHTDSAFFLFCEPKDVTDTFLDTASELHNLMLVVRYDENTLHVYSMLQRAELLYSVWYPYSGLELNSIINGDLFCSTQQVTPIFTALVPGRECCDAVQKCAYQAVKKARNEQSYRTLPWELYGDNCVIDAIISNDACTVHFDQDGDLCDRGKKVEGSHKNLLQCEVGPAAPYCVSAAVSAEPPPEPDLHVSAYPAPSAITITVLGQV